MGERTPPAHAMANCPLPHFWGGAPLPDPFCHCDERGRARARRRYLSDLKHRSTPRAKSYLRPSEDRPFAQAALCLASLRVVPDEEPDDRELTTSAGSPADIAAARRSMEEARRLIHWPRRTPSTGGESLESTESPTRWRSPSTAARPSAPIGPRLRPRTPPSPKFGTRSKTSAVGSPKLRPKPIGSVRRSKS